MKGSVEVKLLAAVFVVDVLLIALHVLFGWSLINLDEEANLSAWYSSIKLFVLFLCAGRIYLIERNLTQYRLSWLWILVAVTFLALSMDETASMHEQLADVVMKESTVGLDVRETVLGGDRMKDSFAWVILFSPFILAVAGFFAFFFWNRFSKHKAVYLTSLAALACYLLAVGLEATIYQSPPLADWSPADLAKYKLLLTIEESGEIFGSSLFILSFLNYTAILRGRGSQAG